MVDHGQSPETVMLNLTFGVISVTTQKLMPSPVPRQAEAEKVELTISI
jgi:hypothetical protein